MSYTEGTSVKNLFLRWRAGRCCCLPLVLLLILVVLAICALLGWGAVEIHAEGDKQEIDVMLIMDQSNSLWELGGIGSDPEMLRTAGARLIAAYLGVDDLAHQHRVGIIFFGSRPKLVMPLTSLDTPGRGKLLSVLRQEPEPMGWTDINAALDLTYQELFASERTDSSHATAIIIFTDGRPQTNALENRAAFDAYLAKLQSDVHRFAAQGTVIFAVLLSSPATDTDPQTRDLYRPLWVDLAESGIGVHFYEARSDQDLIDIYHDITVQLHRERSQGTVLDQVVEGEIETPIKVPAGWQSLSFVVHKSDPAMEVSVQRPGGTQLQVGQPGVRYAAGPGDPSYEVWTVNTPQPGTWLVRVRGQGMVTVWLDYHPFPETPVPTATAVPMATATVAPTATALPSATLPPTPLPTATPTPTPTALAVINSKLAVVEPQAGKRYPRGRSVEVVIELPASDTADVRAFLAGESQPASLPVSLTSDGAGFLRGQTPPLESSGWYTLTVHRASDVGRGVILQDEAHVTFQVKPHWNRFWGALIIVLLALGTGLGCLWRHRRNQPLVEGALRLIQGPEGEETGWVWHLGQWARKTITIGSSTGCDIVLSRDPRIAARAALIRIEQDDDGHARVVLDSLGEAGSVHVNGRAIHRLQQIHDGDVVQVGAYRLQYENLRLRMQDLTWQPHSAVY